MCEPFAFFNEHRLGSERHEVAFDYEVRVLLAKEHGRLASGKGAGLIHWIVDDR